MGTVLVHHFSEAKERFLCITLSGSHVKNAGFKGAADFG